MHHRRRVAFVFICSCPQRPYVASSCQNVRGNAAATDTPAIFDDATAARVHPLVRPY